MTANTDRLNERGLPARYPFKPELEITPRDAHRLLASGGCVIDCRTEQEWNAGRVDGTTLIPVSELESRIDELEDYRQGTIAVMCHTGGRSLRATLLLHSLGFSHARSVAGGIELWAVDIDQSIPRY